MNSVILKETIFQLLTFLNMQLFSYQKGIILSSGMSHWKWVNVIDACDTTRAKLQIFALFLQVLGMERLKLELQSHGLKCGGTLQERASRLFLLKTTPLDKIPKKHLAKK